MIPGAVHKSDGIYLTAEEIPGKTQLRELADEDCVTNHYIKFVSLPLNDVSRKEKEGNQKMVGRK